MSHDSSKIIIFRKSGLFFGSCNLGGHMNLSSLNNSKYTLHETLWLHSKMHGPKLILIGQFTITDTPTGPSTL